MITIFMKILNMSLTATYCIVAVVITRLLLKRQPKIFSYLLWSVVFFRLLCPFSITSSFSLLRMDTDMISQERLIGLYGEDYIVWQEKDYPYDGMAQGAENTGKVTTAASQRIAEQEEVTPVQTFLMVSAWVWFLGMILMIGYGIWVINRFRRFLQKAVLLEDHIYEVEGIPTAFVFGIVHPGIYLPSGLAEEERIYVLEHERVHIVRKDYLVKILAWGVRCIHWFNPLVWLSFVLMERDMEMSCDEAVLRRMGMEAKQDYSRALLSLSSEKKKIGGCPIAFGEGEVKGRIRNILSYRKKTLAAAILTVVLLSVVLLGLAFNPVNQEKEIEEQLRFVTDYANACCGRDGDAIVGFYIDEATAFEHVIMLEKVDGGYTFGYSSPWPDEFRSVLTTKTGDEDGQAEIWYYAWTSDPHVAVWKEEIAFVKTQEGYRITDSSQRYLDSITSLQEYMDAYWIAGEYQFTDYVERGFVEAINYQTESDRQEGSGIDRNAMYRSPETAAEWILNLAGGEGAVTTDRSDGTAVVKYTFSDGSAVTIPMYDANFDGQTENATALTEEDLDTEEANQENIVNNEVWILNREVWKENP